jgi:hypothetical protein
LTRPRAGLKSHQTTHPFGAIYSSDFCRSANKNRQV